MPYPNPLPLPVPCPRCKREQPAYEDIVGGQIVTLCAACHKVLVRGRTVGSGVAVKVEDDTGKYGKDGDC